MDNGHFDIYTPPMGRRSSVTKRKNQPETNVEFVTRMMEFSNYGALAQLFVLEAIRNWSNLVAEADPAKVDSPMINGHA
jgi:hypothetical protein